MMRIESLCRTAITAVLPLLLVAPHAHAALVDCQPPESAPYVVFLNEPEFSTPGAFPSREQMVRFLDALQESLDSRRDRDMAGLPPLPFRVARCVGRVPAIDGRDYTPEVVRNLYDRNVVIEIWGRLDARLQGSRRVDATAQINYLITPVRRAGDQGHASAPGLHRFNYPDGEIAATNFLDLVGNSDLPAFVITAIGLMAFDGEDYAAAQQALCNASPRLQRIRRRLELQPASRPQSEVVARLREFALARAGQALAKAGASGRGGTAALLDPTDPCREGRKP